ncbi:MAG TPA: flagellar biosynthesis regulator FlaF [Caulobacteraceae bacterium]|nr:flagellar biosynthesis regulator FlaF [Caulobacteraceae bacterium]
MSLRAYQQAAQRAETPRDAEYRLFGQVTRALMDLKSTPRDDIAAWIDVLHWNRRLWAALADDCSQEGNALPAATRAQIISLSLYVHRTTSQVMRHEADLDALIELNRTMMQGLAVRSDAA